MVATGAGDEAVAYILVDVVEPFTHIEQVTVTPLYARQALGRNSSTKRLAGRRLAGLRE